MHCCPSLSFQHSPSCRCPVSLLPPLDVNGKKGCACHQAKNKTCVFLSVQLQLVLFGGGKLKANTFLPVRKKVQFFLKAAFDILFTIGSCDSSFSKIAGIPYSLVLGQFSASLGIDLGVSKLSKLRDVRIAQKGLIPPPSTSPFWHRSVLHPKFIIMEPLPFLPALRYRGHRRQGRGGGGEKAT